MARKKTTGRAAEGVQPTEREIFFMLLLSKDAEDFNEISPREIVQYKNTIAATREEQQFIEMHVDPMTFERDLILNNDQIKNHLHQQKFRMRKNEIKTLYNPYYLVHRDQEENDHRRDIINDLINSTREKMLVNSEKSTPENWIWLSEDGLTYLRNHIFTMASLNTINNALRTILNDLHTPMEESRHSLYNWDLPLASGNRLHIRIEKAFTQIDRQVQKLCIRYIDSSSYENIVGDILK